MAPTNITSVVQSLADLLGVHGVASHVIEAIRPEMTHLIENFATRLDMYEKDLQEQKERGDKLEQRVVTLERQMKRQIISEKKRDVAQVRNAIIIRTNKSEKDIRLFISNCIELGGWPSKVPANHLAIVELAPPPGKERATKVYRLILQDGQKASLFSGLQKCDLGSESQIRVDNDVPFFAQNAKKQLEQLSYSLRQKFAKSDKLRVKIFMSNLRLKIRCRDSTARDAKDWWGPEDARADKYFDHTNVIFRPSETPATIPTCKEFYKKIMDDQD